MVLGGDTGTLCSYNGENGTLVPSERALVCVPEEVCSLPARHPWRWLDAGCNLLLLVGLAWDQQTRSCLSVILIHSPKWSWLLRRRRSGIAAPGGWA